jgi:hypothetical protein
MEEHLVQLLANTQLSAAGPRRQAELDLNQAKQNPEYPLALARIGAHTNAPTEIRQSALSTLRKFVEDNWSPDDYEQQRFPIADPTKDQLRSMMLELVLNTEVERKVKTAARYVLGWFCHAV